MLARAFQWLTLLLLGALGWWLWFALCYSAGVALAGLLLAALVYGVLLGAPFLLLPRANQRDPAPGASPMQLLRAWWHEGWLAILVFCWLQPFRWSVIPDSAAAQRAPTGRRGVVLVHGFICNRGLWTHWLAELRQRGHVFVAVNLEPVFGSIDGYARTIDAAVAQVTATTGMPPLLVAHSMGGLAARAWLRACDGIARVHRVVTIGSPHHGTMLGHVGRGLAMMANAQQMVFDGSWLRELDRHETAISRALFICYYSNCDNIVFPSSTATLAGADNRHVAGVPHVALAFDQGLMQETLSLL